MKSQRTVGMIGIARRVRFRARGRRQAINPAPVVAEAGRHQRGDEGGGGHSGKTRRARFIICSS